MPPPTDSQFTLNSVTRSLVALVARAHSRMIFSRNSNLLVALLAFFGAAVDAPRLLAEEAATFLVRTPVDGRRICGLSGRWLRVDDSWPVPVRAWAGFVHQKDGGPALKTIQQRNRTWVKEEFTNAHLMNGENDDALGNEELNERFRHFRSFHPQYFDRVVIEFATPIVANRRTCSATDFDLDGNLSDESRHLIADLSTSEISDRYSAAINSLLLDSRGALKFHEDHLVAQPEEVAPKTESRTTPKVFQELSLGPTQEALRSKLHTLDDVRIRKEHLQKVVDAADALLTSLHDSPQTDSVNEATIDALYRKGRALGYMELPDVVARQPVTDPRALDELFESTFRRLDSMVDTKQPQYILLRIRRERRRGRRAVGLNLVEVYRTTHPNPVWHFKKRYDLLTELGATLHAQQAGAKLWILAEKPARPTCVVFRVPPQHSTDELKVTGDWIDKPPFLEKTLRFVELSDGSREAVAWLDDLEFSLRGAEVVEDSRTAKSGRIPQVPTAASTVMITLRPVSE